MGSVEKRLQCLEQLALALEHLKVRDPQYGRFAHILVDNAVELMLHYQAETALTNKWLFPDAKLQDKSSNQNALGREFHPKVSFARRLAAITADEAEFVLINHGYRNELYHAGLRHEEIIHDLAFNYHFFACRLFQKLKWGIASWSFPIQPPARLKGAWENAQMSHRGDYNAALNAVAKGLETTEITNDPLGKSLGRALEKKILQLDQAIDWILETDKTKKSRVQIIIEAQLWSALFDESKRKKCVPLVTAEEHRALVAKGVGHPVEFLKIVMAPPINDDPINRWQKRSADLERESDYVKATKKYQSVMCEMSDLYEDVMQIGSALENHLDYLRGK
jgi:hypothetical protein